MMRRPWTQVTDLADSSGLEKNFDGGVPHLVPAAVRPASYLTGTNHVVDGGLLPTV